MKVKATIFYQASLFCPVVNDSKVLECENTKKAYQIAYRVYLKAKKIFPNISLIRIKTEKVE